MRTTVEIILLLNGFLECTNAVQLEQVIQRGGEVAGEGSVFCVSDCDMKPCPVPLLRLRSFVGVPTPVRVDFV